jgi:hypothetical protein
VNEQLTEWPWNEVPEVWPGLDADFIIVVSYFEESIFIDWLEVKVKD